MEITEKYDWNLTFKAKGLQQVDREKLIVTDDRVTRGHVKERREKKIIDAWIIIRNFTFPNEYSVDGYKSLEVVFIGA